MNFLFRFRYHTRRAAIVFSLIISFVILADSAFCEENIYNQAKKLLADNQAEAAYDIIWKKVMDEPDNIKFNFLLGKAAMKLGFYENGAAAYERILLKNPDIVKARLNLAIAYYKLGTYYLAEKEFNYLLKTNTPGNIKDKSKKFLAAIQKQQNPHQWKASIAAGRIYNTNVNTGPSDDLVSTINGTIVLSPGSLKIEDWGTIVYLKASHKWDFGLKNGFAWNSKLSLSNYLYDKEDDYNLNFVSLKSGPVYLNRQKFKFSIPLSVDLLEYGHEPYTQLYGISPQLDLLHNNNFSTKLSAIFQHQEYSDNDNSDGSYYYLGAAPRFFWNSKQFMFQWKIGYEWKLATNDIKTYDGIKTKILFHSKICKWLQARFTFEYRNSQYKKQDLTYTATRKKNRYKAGTKVYLPLPWHDLRVIASFDYTNNQSNIDAYDYKRKRTMIKLEKRF